MASLNSTEIEEAKASNPNCTQNCAVCEAHWDCFSGCCGASEPDGVKRCRPHCYDEFDRPFFSDSDESINYWLRCIISEEDLENIQVVGAAAAGGLFAAAGLM